MGANAQTSVPAFTAGQVLTAQQQTEINTGIPVFATTTTRDAAFGGTGEKTLAEGQFAYIEASNTTQFYDGAAWIPLGGLTLIKAQTIGSAVSSVTVSDVFSATYSNYHISITGGAASTSNLLFFQLGATTSGYYYGTQEGTYAAAGGNNGGANTANFRCGGGETSGLAGKLDLYNPFEADETWAVGQYCLLRTTGTSVSYAAYLNNTTSYTAFTILTSTGTITGGTIRVYGYQNS